MKRELAGIKSHLKSVDQRLDGLDQRLDGLDQRLDGVDQRLDGVDQRLDRLESNDKKLFAKVVNIEARLDDMATKSELRDMFDAIMAKMDGFAKLLEDSRFRWTVHADTLLDHDRRLKRLEAR